MRYNPNIDTSSGSFYFMSSLLSIAAFFVASSAGPLWWLAVVPAAMAATLFLRGVRVHLNSVAYNIQSEEKFPGFWEKGEDREFAELPWHWLAAGDGEWVERLKEVRIEQQRFEACKAGTLALSRARRQIDLIAAE